MPTPDQKVARLAALQYSIVTRGQALSSGLSEDEIDGRLARGLWHRLHSCVYMIAGAALSLEGRILAAVLAGGRAALASHTTAATLFQFERVTFERPHIVVPRTRRVAIPGVVVHQSAADWGATKVRKIPVTAPTRALVEIAAIVPPDVLEDALDDVWRRGVVTIEGCISAADRFGQARGTKTLRRLLHDRIGGHPSGSGRENAVRRLLERAGLPRPERQFIVRNERGVAVARPDLAYPDLKIAIEFDSTKWHGSKKSLARDHARMSDLQAHDWLLFPADDNQLTHPDRFVANLKRAITARRTGNAHLVEVRRRP